jgi:hypothetical protein
MSFAIGLEFESAMLARNVVVIGKVAKKVAS